MADATLPVSLEPKGKRVRFSLLTLLLITAIVALAITVSMLQREVGSLRQDVVRLRNETGELHVEDAAKLHLIHVPTDSELEWKWRIWIPEGSSYRVRGDGGLIPKEGYPKEGGAIYLREPGEHVIQYLVRRDPRDGLWYGSLRAQGAGVGKDHHPWVEWPSSVSTSSGAGTSTEQHATGQRVEIIRHRVSQTNSSENIEDPSAGFMIWLEPN